jgi:hypothetical protein
MSTDPLDGGFTFRCLSCKALTYGRESNPVEPLERPMSAVCSRCKSQKDESELRADVWDQFTDKGKDKAEWSL